jgi:hypothetical protein
VRRLRCLVRKEFTVLTLIRGLLFIDGLLGQDNIADLHKRIELYARLGDHVVDFDDAR